MIAMITVFSLIANELQSSGFKTALTNLSHPTHQDYNSVFWFNIIVGAFIYVLLFLSAPLIADFYHEPRLIPLCRYAFLGFVFASMGLVQSAYLFKQFQAKQMAKAASVAVVLSSTVAVGMAACGFSYWSLATQTNLYIATNTFLLWHYSPWRPTWEFSLEPIRRMFRFSYKLLLSCIINDVNNSVLNVLLGSCYSSRAAGIFNQAYQWNYKCVYLLQGMLSQVSQPVMVIAREDRDRQLHILPEFPPALRLLFGGSRVYHSHHHRPMDRECPHHPVSRHLRGVHAIGYGFPECAALAWPQCGLHAQHGRPLLLYHRHGPAPCSPWHVGDGERVRRDSVGMGAGVALFCLEGHGVQSETLYP